MDDDFLLLNGLLLLGFVTCAALALGAFFAWRRPVSQGRIGPLEAGFGYALCVAVVPPAVWWCVGEYLQRLRGLDGDAPSFWTHLADIGVTFIVFGCLWVSWAVAFVLACLAGWRFTVCARRWRDRATA
jgi:hypothetical protein